MPLLAEEIVSGTVAILDTRPLFENPAVVRANDKTLFRSGPFLCVRADANTSTWIDLTSRPDDRGLRLQLRPEWLVDGSPVWRAGPQYVHDARKAFVGPNAAFVEAGARELPHRPHSRPRVSAEGVAAVITEMRRYGNEA